ncbi:reverse transcriptase domain-containing protein [uncultured Desulfuromonas sp.]|uniref:reverse transcriptase domain-containing protein n=1 Tax=uncultured Desulfuromonas sp. TaxID=181013 RepID=UPI002AAAEAF3|nr:reverse transcriptase domain-containing protein [uncultured Desulfuromonas sp.]
MNVIMPKPITAEVLAEAFELSKLQEAFDFVSRKKTRGIDGTTVDKFSEQKHEHFDLIKEKCLKGTYKFSPYLLKLQMKGKGKSPRVISIATIRDRVVLHVVKNLLQQAFPESVNRKLPNNYVKSINDFFTLHGAENTLCYYKTDIVGFYDSIPHDKLLSCVGERAASSFLRILESSIKNPTTSFGSKRAERKVLNKIGVPQGLSISNILADIYMREFDTKLSKLAAGYYRFVDDIILFNIGEDKTCLRGIIEAQANGIDLKLHPAKTVCKRDERFFEYLGYRFELPKITIRDSSIVKFINSVASLITSFRNNYQITIKKYKWINDDAYKNIFIENLNEKITGAISETKRYGWLFYFLEINDEALLHRMDRIIDSFFDRLVEFGNTRPEGLKRLARAYFEAKYNSHGNYIHNYNLYVTYEEKIAYLNKMGKINPESTYSPEDIDLIFERTKLQNLLHLENDIGEIS